MACSHLPWEILLDISCSLIPSCLGAMPPHPLVLCVPGHAPSFLLAHHHCAHASTEHLTPPPCPSSCGASCATQSHGTQQNTEKLLSQAPLISFDPDTNALGHRLSPRTNSDTACREPGHSTPSVLQTFRSSCTS